MNPLPARLVAAMRSPRAATLTFFAVYALLALGYSIAIRPLRAPDERNHFLRAYQISEGRFASAYRVSDEQVGDDLPASLALFSQILENHQQHRISPEQLSAARRVALAPEERAFVEFSTAPYAPLTYLPAAAAIGAGRIAGAGPHLLLYLGRWANVLAASALIAVAIRIAGYAAPALAVVALFPMTLAQVGVVSADAMSFAIAFLWLAIVLNTALAADRFTTRRLAMLVLLALAVSQLRPPFPLLGLVAFAIPLRSLGDRRRTAVAIVGIVAAAGLPAAAWNAYAMQVQSRPSLSERVAPAEQLRYVAEHPGAFADALQRDFRRRAFEYWRQAVGRLGWLNLRLPEWITSGFAVVLAVALFCASPSEPRPLAWQRCLLAVLAVAGVIGVPLMLYMTFNGVGSRYIRGIQGRYFVPLLGLMAFALAHRLPGLSRLRLPMLAGCGVFIAAAHVGTFVTLARAAAGQ